METVTLADRTQRLARWLAGGDGRRVLCASVRDAERLRRLLVERERCHPEEAKLWVLEP